MASNTAQKPSTEVPPPAGRHGEFWLTSGTRVVVGGRLKLVAHSDHGPVTFEVQAEDRQKALIEGDQLVGLAPGSVVVLSHCGEQTLHSLMAIVDPGTDLVQLEPCNGTISPHEALIGLDQAEIENLPFFTGASDSQLENHHVVLFTHWYPYEVYGTHLDTSGVPATLSVVSTWQESIGMACGCDGPYQTEVFLVPSSVSSVSIDYVTNGPWQEGQPGQATGPRVVSVQRARDVSFSYRPNASIVASCSPSYLAPDRPYTITGRLYGPLASLPATLSLGLTAFVPNRPMEQRWQTEPLAVVPVHDRVFSYTVTLPRAIGAGDNLISVAPAADNDQTKPQFFFVLNSEFGGPGASLPYMKWDPEVLASGSF